MNLRALLLCDDVRVEVDGTLTLIGVRNDRLRIRTTPPGPILVEHLAFVVVVSGLSGVDRVGFRGEIRSAANTGPLERALSFEKHVPSADEHNFVFSYSPMVFHELGTFEAVVDIATTTEAVTYRHRFLLDAVD